MRISISCRYPYRPNALCVQALTQLWLTPCRCRKTLELLQCAVLQSSQWHRSLSLCSVDLWLELAHLPSDPSCLLLTRCYLFILRCELQAGVRTWVGQKTPCWQNLVYCCIPFSFKLWELVSVGTLSFCVSILAGLNLRLELAGKLVSSNLWRRSTRASPAAAHFGPWRKTRARAVGIVYLHGMDRRLHGEPSEERWPGG